MSVQRRRQGLGISQYAPYIAAGAGQMLGYGLNKGVKKFADYVSRPSVKRPRTESGSSSVDNTVSFQHDFTQQYRRRRASRKLRVLARNRSNMFHYQLAKNSAQFSRVFNLIYAPATITPTGFADSQTTFNVGLYGGKASSSTGMDSLYQIASDAVLLVRTGKILFKSAVLDCQIQNSDSTNTLVVDAYKYVARREGYDEPNLEWSQAMVNQVTASGVANKMTQNSLECTPFDGPGFGSKFLILDKVRYRIAPNNSVFLQMRDSKNHSFSTARFDYDASLPGPRIQMFKGMSSGWIFVARSAATDATSAFMAPINWKVISTQSYHYSLIQESSDEQGQN